MTIKTLEIIHNALKAYLETQKFECETLERSREKEIERGATDSQIKLSTKIVKDSFDELENIQNAIIEFESAGIVLGK